MYKLLLAICIYLALELHKINYEYKKCKRSVRALTHYSLRQKTRKFIDVNA